MNSCCGAPQTIDGVQREVADHLILQGGSGILISQKCQEDPASRDRRKSELWARKNAKGAVRQLCGALRAGPRLIWCDHLRRAAGSNFPAGLPPITHGIVVTEVFQPVDLQPDADDLPLSCGATPITYLSVNDFLNLPVELRTVPELIAYARIQVREKISVTTLFWPSFRTGRPPLPATWGCRRHGNAAS